MRTRWLAGAALVLGLAGRCAASWAQALNQTSGPWVMERSGTTAGLRGIHAVGGGVAWASGTNGTVLRTEDGGYEWQSCAAPADSAKLDFRGIWAWDANTAIVMSSGPGDASRLYKTTDGCSSWKLLFTNPDKDGFWDAVAFADRDAGIVLGDPTINHAYAPNNSGVPEFTILRTFNGGLLWQRDMLNMRELRAQSGFAAFAASNSALAILDHHAWFGTGGKAGAFVFVGDAYGEMPPHMVCGVCFTAPKKYDTVWFTARIQVAPLSGENDSTGIFSLAFRDLHYGLAVGGDYMKPNDSAGTAAWSVDGGKTWTAAAKPPHGYRSAVAWDAEAKAWIAVGTNGSDISYDDGKTWEPLDDGNWNALSLPWVVGPQGRVAKLGKLPGK
ncbi:MAG TPA: hypothetical protein VGS02_18190 [Acidobacteriaceae bacterium]|nr:hypothetical protein [Acidobacteriaceae bacterium]